MFLKLMGRERSHFRVIEVTECSFCQLPEPTITYKTGEAEITVILEAPAYLVDGRGQTIEAFRFKKEGTIP